MDSEAVSAVLRAPNIDARVGERSVRGRVLNVKRPLAGTLYDDLRLLCDIAEEFRREEQVLRWALEVPRARALWRTTSSLTCRRGTILLQRGGHSPIRESTT